MLLIALVVGGEHVSLSLSIKLIANVGIYFFLIHDTIRGKTRLQYFDHVAEECVG